jgi:membrane-bound metal-dependent hydrolase YbcI (DUF457 family)
MLAKTHLAIAIFTILLFIPYISGIAGKAIFSIVVLMATLLPDVDAGFSTINKIRGLGFIGYFLRHRGWVHSFLPAVVISLVFAIFLPILALPFFLGYSLHIFIDSFTMEGVMPFWPYKRNSNWHMKTGSYVETTLFVVFIIADFLFLVFQIKRFL